MKLFAVVFEDYDSYQSAVPNEEYVTAFLRNDAHVVLVATADDGAVVGGLVAYELQKFEQARRELYIYDFAVSKLHQRQGIGAGLVEALKNEAHQRGIHAIFVQADKTDEGAVAFYRSLSTSEVDGFIFDL